MESPISYRFGRWLLRPHGRELLLDGTAQSLGARAFDLLHALLASYPNPATRQALFDAAWSGRVVGDDNLKVQVMALRRTIGADAVATVPGVGYRFALPVQVVSERDRRDATLVGRDAELAALQQQLARARLVSVVGPPGIGKTRLARALVAMPPAGVASGVVWVELGALADDDLLAAAVAHAAQLPGAAAAGDAALAAALAPLSLLVVLDNAEHLVAACGRLARRLLDAAPRLRLLVTSQAPLGLAGEQVLRLAPLPLPGAATTAEQAAGDTGALALFVDRVRGADPGFVLDASNVDAVCTLVRRLDGVPSALELAATRLPLLGAAGLLERLDRQLDLLAERGGDARHASLRAALATSHAQLGDVEQRVLRRLAVFAGSFALDAAQAVACGDEGDDIAVLDALETLVQRSWLQREGGGGSARLAMLDSMRRFAAERLAEAGEYAAARAPRRRSARALRSRRSGGLHDAAAGLARRAAARPRQPACRAALGIRRRRRRPRAR